MKITATEIPDVLLLEPTVHGDHRGFFMETFRQSLFDEHVPGIRFVQDNHSKSAQGILRGLHYQLKQPQGKLVRVVAGEIYDVAVDMRQHSPTFGQSVGALLSADNHHQLWVPPGFAHGFYVTSDSAEMVYKCSDYYAPDDEYSLLWNDPALNIDWPLVAGVAEPVLSDKDRHGLLLRDAPVFNATEQGPSA
ncbi:MAG: dTDP-4-dehydrorhamnose 3,5-epimerase [Gammaproteobacteria bacterium]|nr:dTDP-4-dehydrorhamnose 3,5-epimerase [Gammaproteobacteria bacterium]